jgi:hypothetical protein
MSGEAENERLREALKDTLAHLTAAISLLERSPKTAAPSNKMFDLMLSDHRASVERAREALSVSPTPAVGGGSGISQSQPCGEASAGAEVFAGQDAEPSGHYTPDEARVAKWIVKRSGIGGGDDPIGFLLASYDHMRAERDTAQSAVTAWRQATESLEAHIMDRAAMQDPASPDTYLRILRGEIESITRATEQIVAARWADYRRQEARIEALSAAPASPKRGPFQTLDEPFQHLPETSERGS